MKKENAEEKSGEEDAEVIVKKPDEKELKANLLRYLTQ